MIRLTKKAKDHGYADVRQFFTDKGRSVELWYRSMPDGDWTDETMLLKEALNKGIVEFYG